LLALSTKYYPFLKAERGAARPCPAQAFLAQTSCVTTETLVHSVSRTDRNRRFIREGNRVTDPFWEPATASSIGL